MQAGTFGTVPAVSVLALLAGRKRLAASLAVGGTIAWVGAKLIKPFGGRARPQGVLPDVTIREGIEGDLGWVSGHTAVATTLAFVAAEELPRAARPVLAAIVGTVGFGRMYVGAHLPHDVRRRRRPRDDDLGRDPAGRGRLSHPASALGSRRRCSVAFRNWAATKIRATRNRNSIITTASPSAPYRSLL